MEKKTDITVGSTGFVGILQVAFIVLKLCGVIDWSWIWVLAPLWISFAIGILSIIIFVIICKKMTR